LAKLGQVGRDFIFTSLWASILSVQLLGLMFTFTRGSWGGAVLALVVFLVLVVFSLGFRMLLRSGLVLGLAAILSVAFLHWQGSVSFINTSVWIAPSLALLGLAGTLSVLFVIKKFGTAVVLIAAVGAITTIVAASVIAPYALSGRGDTGSADTGAISGQTAEQVAGRITSIKTDVLGGFVGGRGTHWKVSWELIKNRPWFEFDDLGLSWLRPLIGYGPDLFRYTYLLESTPEPFDLRPLEPDHAHNFFIHQTVEQGAIGGWLH
jgi:O-antigen ligase